MIYLTKNDKNFFTFETPFRELNIGIAARSANTIDYGRDLAQIRKDEKQFLHSYTGIQEKNILFLNQVHGDTVLTIDEPPSVNGLYLGDADAVITSLPYVCPVIRTADCVPVIVYDPEHKIIAAVHSGWKGTHLGIAAKTVRTMKEKYGSEPVCMHIFLLPSIGPDSYVVNEDVSGYFPEDVQVKNGRIYLDLWKNIQDSVIRERVRAENIFLSGICNFINNREFFSHRRGDGERNLNFCYLSK
jgi:YfiH family protein